MANVLERSINRKGPKWMATRLRQWGTEDERHHRQRSTCGDEPHE